jgi:soluble P-type ATPase
MHLFFIRQLINLQIATNFTLLNYIPKLIKKIRDIDIKIYNVSQEEHKSKLTICVKMFIKNAFQ